MAKNKKNSKNKMGILNKIVLFLALMAVASGFWLMMARNAKTKTALKEAEQMEQDSYNIIMNYDFDNNYPQTPEQVVEYNNFITVFLYGGQIEDEQIKPILEVERKLLSQEILEREANSLENQVVTLTESLRALTAMNQKLIKTEMLNSVYSDMDPDVCTIIVIQHTNVTDNNYINYNLKKEEGLWKITSWEKIGEKPTSEGEI